MHVITRFIRGGADENTLITCNAQARSGHAVTLVYGAGFHADMIARLDGAVRPIHLRSLCRQVDPLQDLRCLAELIHLLRRERIEVLHTHESKAGVLGRVAGRLVGVPVVVHGVHILAHLHAGRVQSAMYKTAERLAARCTDVFIDVSEGMKRACLEAGLGTAAQHRVIESGMDLEAVCSGQRARAMADPVLNGLLPQAPIFVLVAGSLEPRKRIVEFLDVFGSAARRSPRLCLLIAGDGPEREAIEARINALGLGGRVRCIGFRDDLPDWIALADICVHCAAHEGLPRVVVQYVANSKPVIVPNLIGIERLVRNSENGFVVDADGLDAMTEILASLADSPDQRAQMASASGRVSVEEWAAESMVERIEAAYRDVMAGRVGGGRPRPGGAAPLPS